MHARVLVLRKILRLASQAGKGLKRPRIGASFFWISWHCTLPIFSTDAAIMNHTRIRSSLSLSILTGRVGGLARIHGIGFATDGRRATLPRPIAAGDCDKAAVNIASRHERCTSAKRYSSVYWVAAYGCFMIPSSIQRPATSIAASQSMRHGIITRRVEAQLR